jgi:ParB/RepB/Spo0J family partition protein
MATTIETGEYDKPTRSDVFHVDPRSIVPTWDNNISRGRREPVVNDDLIDLAKDLMPRKGASDTEEGTSGQLQPVLVRKLSDHRLEIVAGFRRLRAFLYAYESGLTTDAKIMVKITTLNPLEAALANIAENMQRTDPEPIDFAHAIRYLIDQGMSLKAIAGRLKRSQQNISALLSLVTLPSDIQESVASGETTIGAGVELANAPEEMKRPVFEEVKAQGGKKVKVTEVKAAIRARKEAAGETATGKLSPREFRDWLQSKGGPAEDPAGQKLVDMLLAFWDGKKTIKTADRLWEQYFPTPVHTAEDENVVEAAVPTKQRNKKAS